MSFSLRTRIVFFAILCLGEFARAFDITFNQASCTLLSFTLTLEPFEVEQGYEVQVKAVDNGSNHILYPIFLSTNGYTTSSLTHTFSFETNYYKQSGRYPVQTLVFDSNGNTIQYNNDGTADSEIDIVNVVCSTSVPTLTTTVTSTTTFSSTTKTTTPLAYSTSTTTTSSRYSPTTTGYMTDTFTYYCLGTPTITSVIHTAQQTYYVNEYCPSPPKNKGAILGGAIGGSLAFLIVLAGVVFTICTRRRKKYEQDEFSGPPIIFLGNERSGGDMGHELEKENEYGIETHQPYG